MTLAVCVPSGKSVKAGTPDPVGRKACRKLVAGLKQLGRCLGLLPPLPEPAPTEDLSKGLIRVLPSLGVW